MRAGLVTGVAMLAGVASGYVWAPIHAASRTPPPNIVLITIDTLRADHVGAYGDADAATPNIDALARRGVRFDQAFAHAPLTFPSHVSIMTGELPTVSGARDNGWQVLGPQATTIAARVKAAGYHTAAFVSSFILAAQFGLDQGFDVYDDHLDSSGPLIDLDLRRSADQTSAAAVRWIGANHASPFFVWVHFYDPHAPYGPAPAGRPLYDAAVTRADAGVGRIVEALTQAGIANQTVIVLTGDHGEGLGDHGETQHGLLLYDSVIHVPLIVDAPGVSPVVVSSQVGHIDIAPTIFQLAGSPVRGLPGRDLLARVSDQTAHRAAPADEEIYGESWYGRLHFDWSEIRFLRGDGWKYIDGPDPELYDVRHDAAESKNLASQRAQLAAAMRTRLHAIEGGTTQGQTRGVAPDSATIARLQSLGYVSGDANLTRSTGTDAARPDPKRMLSAFEAYETVLNDGVSDLVASEPARAVQAFQTLVREYPQSYGARHYLGYALAAEHQDAAAVPEYERTLQLNPQFAIAHFDLAKSLAILGRSREASAHIAAGLQLEPRSVYGVMVAGVVAWVASDNAGAERYFRQATQLAPDEPRAFANLGEACMRDGDLACAQRAFERLIRLDYSVAAAHFNLGVIAEHRGAVEDAKKEYSSALAADSHLDAARQALKALGGK